MAATRLTLLATNDLHGHLAPAAAAQLAALKAEAAAAGPVLLLDAGDAIARGNISWRAGGEWMHDRMRAAGYDALALGNREYHPWRGPQAAKLRRAPAPIVCSNVRPAGWGGTVPSLRLALADGLTVRLLGLTPLMITADHPLRWISASRFLPPAEAVTEQLAAVDDRELVIVLSHSGERADRALAAACPQLAVILGGHSHTPFDARIGDTHLAQAPAHGAALTKMTLAVDGPQVRQATVERVPLTQGSAR